MPNLAVRGVDDAINFSLKVEMALGPIGPDAMAVVCARRVIVIYLRDLSDPWMCFLG